MGIQNINPEQILEHMEEIQKDTKALQEILDFAELLKDSGRMSEGCFDTLLPLLHGAIDGSQRAFDVFELELGLRGEK